MSAFPSGALRLNTAVSIQDATGLRRGLAIVEALAAHGARDGEPLGVVRIAELVGREKSQVSRTLRILDEHGLVERDPATRGYRLGWRLYALAARTGPQRLLALAPAVLRRLVADLGETAHLSVLDGSDVLTLLTEAPSTAIQATGRSGRSVAVACTSSGRALLFDHDRAALDAVVANAGLPQLGPNAPRTTADLWARLAEARERGHALLVEESEPGLVAAAAPVRDFRGQIVAAVNVSGPRFRLGERLGAAGQAVEAAAAELAHALGGDAAPGEDRG
jgi:IclR family transcriptional regulator, KDG regulon repressor